MADCLDFRHALDFRGNPRQCDQVLSGEITTSGFRYYYIRAKITTVPYFSNFSIFFPYFPQKCWRENKNFLRSKIFSGEPPYGQYLFFFVSFHQNL